MSAAQDLYLKLIPSSDSDIWPRANFLLLAEFTPPLPLACFCAAKLRSKLLLQHSSLGSVYAVEASALLTSHDLISSQQDEEAVFHCAVEHRPAAQHDHPSDVEESSLASPLHQHVHFQARTCVLPSLGANAFNVLHNLSQKQTSHVSWWLDSSTGCKP